MKIKGRYIKKRAIVVLVAIGVGIALIGNGGGGHHETKAQQVAHAQEAQHREATVAAEQAEQERNEVENFDQKHACELKGNKQAEEDCAEQKDAEAEKREEASKAEEHRENERLKAKSEE